MLYALIVTLACTAFTVADFCRRSRLEREAARFYRAAAARVVDAARPSERV